MAFKASNITPSKGLDRAKQLCLQYETYLTGRRASFVAGTTADVVLATYFDSIRFRDEMAAISALPGIVTYAQAQENDGSYDVVTEFTAMLNAIDALTTEINTLFPVDGSGYLLDRQFSVDGKSLDQRVFTPAQLSSLLTLIDNVTAAIE
jgi:hypothetical protein